MMKEEMFKVYKGSYQNTFFSFYFSFVMICAEDIKESSATLRNLLSRKGVKSILTLINYI